MKEVIFFEGKVSTLHIETISNLPGDDDIPCLGRNGKYNETVKIVEEVEEVKCFTHIVSKLYLDGELYKGEIAHVIGDNREMSILVGIDECK